MADIHSRFREVREEHRLSQEELANLLKVNRGTVTQIEGGRQNPTIDQITNLCLSLDVDINWLFFGIKRVGENDPKYIPSCHKCAERERIIEEKDKRIHLLEQHIVDLREKEELLKEIARLKIRSS